LEKGRAGGRFVRGLRCQKDQQTVLFLTFNAVKIGETKHLVLYNHMNFYKETVAALSMYQPIFSVVRTVNSGMKLYNDQRNAQVFNLSVYSLQPYMSRAFF
jgi:hypothetical protein